MSSYDRYAVRPLPGTLWAWEPNKTYAAALVKVIAIQWNSEEWFVGTETLAEGPPGLGQPTLGKGMIWNDLGRFWEAAHRVSARSGPVGPPGLTRRGAPLPEEKEPQRETSERPPGSSPMGAARGSG